MGKLADAMFAWRNTTHRVILCDFGWDTEEDCSQDGSILENCTSEAAALAAAAQHCNIAVRCRQQRDQADNPELPGRDYSRAEVVVVTAAGELVARFACHGSAAPPLRNEARPLAVA